MKAQTVSQKFRKTDCPTCSGRGRVWYPGCGESDVECGNCYGDGFVSEGDWDDDWEDPRLDLDAEPLIPEKSEYLETWFEIVKESLGLPSNIKPKEK